MNEFWVLLVVCVCFGSSEFVTNIFKVKSPNAPDVYYDVQISGFNSPIITSGPIVFQDRQTIFIPNLVYNGPQVLLSYWTGSAGPNGQKIPITQEQFLKNHTNIYINLPAALSIDSLNFLGVGVDQTVLTYVLLDTLDKSSIRIHQDSTQDSKLIYRIPKCCPQAMYVDSESGCKETGKDVEWNVTIFESNATGLDPDIKLKGPEFELRPYYYNISCDNGIMAGVNKDDTYGLIYNSSLIIRGEGIKLHHEFCLDLEYNNLTQKYDTVTIVCYQLAEEGFTLTLYLPVLVISMICFAITAIIYGLLLKKGNEIIKQCVILFSATMSVACLSLLILNVQSNRVTCNLFGFLFLITAIFSFIWLGISCFEILFLIRFPLETNRNQKEWRFHCYIGISCGVSLLMLVISLFSGHVWQPDIPNTFVRYSNQCSFTDVSYRMLIMFVPMAISVVLSLIFVIYAMHLIRKNDQDENVRNEYDWIEKKIMYPFMCRTYMVIIFASFFWFAHIFYDGPDTPLALDVLEASFGIITLTTFVLNKYTLKEIGRRLKSRNITDRSLQLTQVPTPTTPELEEEPLNSHMNSHRNNNQ